MTEEEVSKLYARLALQYEAVLGTLFSKHLIFEDFVPGIRKDFYDTLNEDKLREFGKIKEYDSIIRRYMQEMTSDESVSLTELAKQYSDEAPSYVIQSWMRSSNTMEFLRLWENEMNAEFDDTACGGAYSENAYNLADDYPIVMDSGNARFGNGRQARQRRWSESLSRNCGRLSSVAGSKSKVGFNEKEYALLTVITFRLEREGNGRETNRRANRTGAYRLYSRR